jgi:hypothetical protein
MAYERRPNNCGLFANTRSPDKSDYTAELDVQCPSCGVVSSYWVNAWRKLAKTGIKWISLSLRAKGQRPAVASRPAVAPVDNDDIPW